MRTPFTDEFLSQAKYAAASQRLLGSKTRAGRRPMRVSTLLKKEKDGSFYKVALAAYDTLGAGVRASHLASEAKEDARYDEAYNKSLSEGWGFPAGLTVGAVGTPALGWGGHQLAKKTLEGNTPRGQELSEKLLKAHPDVVHVEHPLKTPLESFYGKMREGIEELPAGTPVVVTGKNTPPSILSHELGHHSFGKGRFGHFMQDTLSTGLRKPAATAGLGAGSAGVGALSSLIGGPAGTAMAVGTPFLAEAPTLMSEGAATLSGLRQLSRAGASKGEVLRAAVPLAGAFGTYLARPVANAGISYTARRLMQAHQAGAQAAEAVPTPKKTRKPKAGATKEAALVLPKPEEKKTKKQDVDEFMKHVNDYLLMTTPKTAAAYWKDKLPGGLADRKKPEDFDPKELKAGEKVEAEHTSDPHLRKEITMDHLVEFPHGYYPALHKMESKLEKKSGLDRPMSLSIMSTGSEKEWGGAPILGKRKRGDSPTTDGSEGIDSAGTPTWQSPQSAIAPKVASLHPQVPSSDEFPTLDEEDRVPTRMNRLRDEPVVSMTGNAALQNQRTDATTKLAHQFLIRLQMEKVASDPNLSEMEKEAILQQLRSAAGGIREMGRALVGAPVRLNLGDEVVHVAGNRLLPKVPSYKGVGQGLHRIGESLKGPAGMLPEEAKAMGFHTSVGSRIAGEAASSAGHHMSHASTTGKLMNPLGKPFGGALEGLARGTGRELERASGAVATGLTGAGRATMGGGVLGQAGRHLQQAAPHIGTVGEIAGAAGTATGLGAAVSPAAAGLAAGLKSMGVYAPLKAHFGAGALNVAKDALAHGAEKGIEHGTRLIRGRAA